MPEKLLNSKYTKELGIIIIMKWTEKNKIKIIYQEVREYLY